MIMFICHIKQNLSEINSDKFQLIEIKIYSHCIDPCLLQELLHKHVQCGWLDLTTNAIFHIQRLNKLWYRLSEEYPALLHQSKNWRIHNILIWYIQIVTNVVRLRPLNDFGRCVDSGRWYGGYKNIYAKIIRHIYQSTLFFCLVIGSCNWRNTYFSINKNSNFCIMVTKC